MTKYQKKMKSLLILITTALFPIGIYCQTSKEFSNFISLGSLAPSSHNAQMWKVKTDTIRKTIQVSLDDRYLLSAVDPNNREAWISIGAFAQNCILSATDKGYICSVNFENDVVIITLKKSSNPLKTNYTDLIKRRRTFRKPFLQKQINPESVQKLQLQSDDVYFYGINSSNFKTLVKLSQQANTEQMTDINKMKELSKWILFSKKEENKRADGLTLRKLGMNAIQRFFFRIFVSKRNFYKNNLIKKLIIKKTNKLYNLCGGYILITSKGSTPEDWFNSGMLLEKIWLSCIGENLAVHPMSQVIEQAKYYAKLKNRLNLNKEIQMVLRIGVVKNIPHLKKVRRKVHINPT